MVAALEAAALLVPQGAYLEALEVLDELRGVAATRTLEGLHAFQQLPAQLAAYAQVRSVRCCLCSLLLSLSVAGWGPLRNAA